MARVEIVLYNVDGQTVAVGYLESGRQFLHGKRIPPGHKVVRFTWVRSMDISSPLVLRDPEENCFLSAGQFFALPTACLAAVKLVN